MALAGLLLALVIFISLPLCAWRPWIGMLIFLWLCFMTPQHLTAGFAYDFPFARLVAVAILLGVPFAAGRSPLPRTAEVYLIGALWCACLLSTLFTAIEPDRAWAASIRVSKVFLMTAITLILFRDRRRLRLLLLVIAGSIAIYGVTGGVYAIATRGTEIVWGPPESILLDNNTLAFALALVLPLLVFLRYDEDRPWVRHLLLAAYGLSIVAVLATYSRGGLIVLLVVVACLAVMTFRRDRTVIVVALAAFALAAVAPPRWHNRVQTLGALSQNKSANKRARSAYVAFRLGWDHPVLGAGFEPFSPAVYQRYIPGYSDDHNAHNHYLQVFAEHGLAGLLPFVALLACVLWRLLRTIAAARGDPARRWVQDYASALAIGMIAYAVAGVFLNRPYFEPFYQLIAAAVLLDALQRDYVADRRSAAAYTAA